MFSEEIVILYYDQESQSMLRYLPTQQLCLLFNFSFGNKALKIKRKFVTIKKARFPHLTQIQTLTTKQALDFYQLQRSPCIQNVGCSNPCRDRVKSFKQIVTAILLNAQQQAYASRVLADDHYKQTLNVTDHECIGNFSAIHRGELIIRKLSIVYCIIIYCL